MCLTETILDENGKFPLTAPAFQQLPLIVATVIGTYDLAIGAPPISQSATLAILNPKLVCKKR